MSASDDATAAVQAGYDAACADASAVAHGERQPCAGWACDRGSWHLSVGRYRARVLAQPSGWWWMLYIESSEVGMGRAPSDGEARLAAEDAILSECNEIKLAVGR